MNTPKNNRQPGALDQAKVRLEQQDYSGAERLARQALAEDPKSLQARNFLAVVFGFTEREDQAIQILREIMEAHGTEPDAYYNLASLLHKGGKPEESLAALEKLFARATFHSPGPGTVYSSALSLCQQVQSALADKHHERACQEVQGLSRSIEALTGYPVAVLSEDLPQGVNVAVKTGWVSDRRQHVLRCSRSFPRLLQPHLIAHHLIRIELLAQARKTGKLRGFTTTPANAQFLKRLLCLRRPQICRLLDKGVDPEFIARAAWDTVNRLLRSLYTCPIELVVETSLRDRLPVLAASQFLDLARYFDGAPNPAELFEREQILPRTVTRIGLALNCVQARLLGSLFANTSALALAYKPTEVYPLASRLWNCWQAAAASLGPADEYLLVDRFAEILGLRNGYEWVPLTPEAGPISGVALN